MPINFDGPTTLQSTVNIVAILAVVLAVGRLVQNLSTLSKLVAKIDERLIGHMLDRTVHPDVTALEKDIAAAAKTADEALTAARSGGRHA